jgi:hypothetical protein
LRGTTIDILLIAVASMAFRAGLADRWAGLEATGATRVAARRAAPGL